MKDALGYEMTASHSETEIYKGCLSLMAEVSGRYLAYMHEFLGIDFEEMPEDERPHMEFYPTHIIEHLFLWGTSHSGGTSQHMKCWELGIEDDETVVFGYVPEEEEDE